MDKKGTVRRLFVLMGGYRRPRDCQHGNRGGLSAAMNLGCSLTCAYTTWEKLYSRQPATFLNRPASDSGSSAGTRCCLSWRHGAGIYGIGLLFASDGVQHGAFAQHAARVPLGGSPGLPRGKSRSAAR